MISRAAAVLPVGRREPEATTWRAIGLMGAMTQRCAETLTRMKPADDWYWSRDQWNKKQRIPYGLSATKVLLAYAKGHGGHVRLLDLTIGPYGSGNFREAASRLAQRGKLTRERLGVYTLTHP